MKLLRLCGSALLGTVALAACAPSSDAQAASNLRVEASGRATTQVTIAARGAQGGDAAAPLVVSVDYGQPHARGRVVVGTLIPYDEVWRTGANQSTTLRTDVDLELGGVRVPRGNYSLYSLLTRDGWQLIVNRQTGQWGTQYDAAQDLARVALQSTEAAEPAESFSITFVPATEAPAHGSLVLSWGTIRGSTPWRALP
ncbi:MAG: DUF2911 domain-containing protein [Gemmatimonadaceae bacterium]